MVAPVSAYLVAFSAMLFAAASARSLFYLVDHFDQRPAPPIAPEAAEGQTRTAA
jgi:hypothetical protein